MIFFLWFYHSQFWFLPVYPLTPPTLADFAGRMKLTKGRCAHACLGVRFGVLRRKGKKQPASCCPTAPGVAAIGQWHPNLNHEVQMVAGRQSGCRRRESAPHTKHPCRLGRAVATPHDGRCSPSASSEWASG
ncbi:hypothetical protein F5883DRAFT_559398 [Diaporthe sp. PMI_573]|nr:hypothetical protein F5883DRAFT_559398 [Diaporthaceae sp. PMI_573]